MILDTIMKLIVSCDTHSTRDTFLIMRFFIALEIPEKSKQEIAILQNRIKKIIPDLKLSDPDKLHITIAFVGEETDQLREPLVEVLTKGIEGIHPFTVTPAYVDGFPSLHHARILWIGVKGDIDKLFIIRERIKDGLKSLHLDTDERRFIPHIALGKMHGFNLTPTQELELEKIESTQFDSINVDSIKLFESIPNHGFHDHNTLAEIKLI